MAAISPEIRERVRGYITHQAAKDPAAIRNIVQEGHQQLHAQIDGLSDAQASFKPAPDVWSVIEVLRHVEDAKRGVARICEMLARGDSPAGFGAEGQAEKRQLGRTGRGELATLGELRDAIETAHAQLIAFIDAMSDEANTESRYEHGFFGMLNCREWAAFQRVHDGDHTRQIEQVKASPGYPAA